MILVREMKQKTKQGVLSLVALLLVLAGGCRVALEEPEVGVTIPEHFNAIGTAPLEAKWWETLEDDTLDGLIEQALAENFDLQTAWDRLVQAHAVARQSDSGLWPQANLDIDASRTRRDTDGDVTYGSLYSIGAAASYEVDLWSRLRATRRAAWLDARATRDALDTAAITLSATVAGTWYQLAEAQDLVRIAEDQIATNEQVLDLVVVQFRKGAASAADVLRQRQLVAATEATLIQAEENVALLQYTLSVLVGHPPAPAWQDVAIELPILPPMPSPGLPTDVLLRRPDVQLAYRQVQSADQRLAVAIANQYPRLSLAASASTSATQVSDLFDDWLANIAGNLVQPLFDANLRKAEVQRQRAVVRERFHTWSQIILEALLDVEIALTQEKQQAQLFGNLTRQLDLARQTYDRIRESFMKGQIDYIRVLESLQSMQSLERQVVQARRLLIQRRIDLYRAIAGPWDLPTPAAVQADDPDSMTEKSQSISQDR